MEKLHPPIPLKNIEEKASQYREQVRNSSDGFRPNSRGGESEYAVWVSILESLREHPALTFPIRLLATGTIFCFVFVLWAWLGSLPEVGRVVGKLVPDGETYKVQPLESGKIREVKVKEGDTVKVGQVIAELDTAPLVTEVQALQKNLQEQRRTLSVQQNRLQQLNRQEQTQAAAIEADEQATLANLTRTRAKLSTLQQQIQHREAKLKTYQERYLQVQTPLSTRYDQIVQLQEKRDSYRQEVDLLENLANEGAISRETLQKTRKALLDTDGKLARGQWQETSQSQEMSRLSTSAQELELQIARDRGELARSYQEVLQLQTELAKKRSADRSVIGNHDQEREWLQQEIAQLKDAIAETQSGLSSARAKLKDAYLRASVDGVVSSLQVPKAGESVQAGQIVAEITPQGAPLRLEARVHSHGESEIAEGLPVQVTVENPLSGQIEAIEGTVKTVALDTSENSQRGQIYRLEISLDPAPRARSRSLKPGQTAEAEILFGERRVADILLQPMVRVPGNERTS
jgi:hemolysin D